MAAVTAPANFTVTPTTAKPGDTLTFRWEAASGSFNQYRIYGGISPSGDFTPSVYVDGNKLTATGTFPENVPKGGYVNYSVYACTVDEEGFLGDGPVSNTVRVYRAVNSPPDAPGFLTAEPLSGHLHTLISLSWGASTDVDGNFDHYEVERCVNGSWHTVFSGNWLDTKAEIPYDAKGSIQFRVRAVDTDGACSPYVASQPIIVLADIFPDGGRLELFQNAEAKPVFPVTVLDGVFRRSDKKPLSAILSDAGGVQGPPGQGIPTGGAAGQLLAKASAADYDAQWVDPPSGGGTAVSGVTSFKGRTGAVTPQKGDYTAADVGALPAGDVQAVRVLTQTEYDALTAKSGNTLYLIKE